MKATTKKYLAPLFAVAVVVAATTAEASDLVWADPGWMGGGGSGDDTFFHSPYTLGPWGVGAAMGAGNDHATGGYGDDALWGEEGDDVLVGSLGDDGLYGGTGHDALYGGGGNDRMYGGEGNDFLVGGTGKDYLDGGEGNDALIGGGGADKLYGYIGADLYLPGDGKDTIYFKENDFDGGDVIVLNSPISKDVFYSHPPSMDAIHGERGQYYGTFADMRKGEVMPDNEGMYSETSVPRTWRKSIESVDIPSIYVPSIGTFTMDKSVLRDQAWGVSINHHTMRDGFTVVFLKKD